MRKRQSVLTGQMALDFDVFAVHAQSSVISTDTSDEVDTKIRQAVGTVLDRAFDAGQSRERVADAMTAMLSRPVGKAQLDQWAAPSQADRRIPVDAWMALMDVTSDYSPLEWMAVHAQRRVLTIDEALCAEFGAMAALELHIKQKKSSIESLMDAPLLAKIIERMQGRAGK